MFLRISLHRGEEQHSRQIEKGTSHESAGCSGATQAARVTTRRAPRSCGSGKPVSFHSRLGVDFTRTRAVPSSACQDWGCVATLSARSRRRAQCDHHAPRKHWLIGAEKRERKALDGTQWCPPEPFLPKMEGSTVAPPRGGCQGTTEAAGGGLQNRVEALRNQQPSSPDGRKRPEHTRERVGAGRYRVVLSSECGWGYNVLHGDFVLPPSCLRLGRPVARAIMGSSI